MDSFSKKGYTPADAQRKKFRNYSALQIKAIDNESTFDSFL
jgi:hypothetical protein